MYMLAGKPVHPHTPTHPHPQVIQEHSPRQTSRNKISKLEKLLAHLIGKKEELAKVLDLRKKQFHLLVQCIHRLQDELQSDDVAMETE